MSSTLWKIRIIASQCFAALPIYILKFTYGSFVGLTLVLSSQQEEISMNSIHKKLFVEMLLCAQSIIGLTTGMIEGPSYTYLAEITQPLFRNTLMAALDLSFLVGTLFFVLITEVMHWKNIALINLVFPIIGLSLMFFIPESPYWLANKNRYERIARSLSLFRGWKFSDSVKAESYLIINNAKKSPAILKHFCQRSFYIPLLIVFFTLLVDTVGGSQILLVNLNKIMKELKSPINKSTVAIIIMSGRTICAIVCTLSIHIAGKRLLVFVSIVTGSIFLIISSIFGFLIVKGKVTAEAYFWIPSFTLIVSIFTLTTGIRNVSLILNSEIFPTKLRQISTGIGFFVRYIMLLILQAIFLSTIDSLSAPGILLIFGFINIIGFILLYYIFPETGNRCLIEIEEFYVGNKVQNKNFNPE
ncbi:facilitated trehalose transporter Tret1-like [Phymastichus coffea]|uniref:facilitated trehalose transporter Tret1-like n=1 Tax=Phymastichus coffea TaxID=108790 RepID=UPI00273ABDA0|nr:facilitated trehalose transporter Tret1-like [Phymastichus coffea]